MFAWWGRAVVKLRWTILAVAAFVVVAGATWGAGVFGDLISGGFDDPGSPSSKAREQITAQLGRQDPDVIALFTGDQLQAPVQEVMAEVKSQPEVVSVVNGPVSIDGRSTFLAIQLRDGDEDSKLTDLAAIEPLLAADGVKTEVGGLIPFLDDANKQISEDITKAELISLPILLILLIFIFRGLVAAATPLLVGVLAVVGAFVAVRVLAQVTDVSVFAINIITMLGLGMAIDYSLFIVSRFREELAAGKTVPEAIALTITTAGRTVLISGLTVALALASLLVFPLDFLKSMAWGGMSAVLVAMLAALTALPALLAVLGHRINAVRVPLPKLSKGEGGWARLAHSVMRRPVFYAAGVTALLLALAIPFLRIEFGGFDERVLPAATESRVVSERLNAGFPGGGSSPVQVLANEDPAGLDQRIRALDGVSGTQVNGPLILVSYPGEPTSEQARDLVREIRELPGSHLVGGRSAADVDQLDAFTERLPWMLLLIAVSTFIVLFFAFGSILLPLKAILMNVISIGASFGVVVWIFQDGHFADFLGFTVTGFLEPANLVLMFAILFGLATDYEVFLLSRVREEWDATGDNNLAVARGLQRTGGIITAAALLLIIVIGGFATGGTATIKLLGVGTVVAVAVDAGLVRTLLVPATMRLLGKWNWWAPGPLAKLYRRYGIRES
jgi:uncharacterized membrane protein YdfJ with MMPL/SSD domain